jgi:hypothetical protein
LKTFDTRIEGESAACAHHEILALAAAGERDKQEKDDKICSFKPTPKPEPHVFS